MDDLNVTTQGGGHGIVKVQFQNNRMSVMDDHNVTTQGGGHGSQGVVSEHPYECDG